MLVHLKDLSTADAQHYLQHAVAPRPICFASTRDKKGNINLAPFSFFNLFSSNPPIAIFSPARRVRNNTTKHTLENVMEVPEVVIHIVDNDIIQQVSLASCEYPQGVNEFEKAGFTMEPATLVSLPMVKESKIKMECRVTEIKHLGTEGGAGNLIFCEVLCMHIDDAILNERKKIDQQKISHVARLGGDWYVKCDKENLFLVPKPNTKLGMGFDMLPSSIRNSKYLTGNHLGMLANETEIPNIDPSFDDEKLKQIIQYYSNAPEEMEKELHRYAAILLDEHKPAAAWQVLLAGG